MSDVTPFRCLDPATRSHRITRLEGRIVRVTLVHGVHPVVGRVVTIAVQIPSSYTHAVVLDRGLLEMPAVIPLAVVDAVDELTGPELVEQAARLYPRRELMTAPLITGTQWLEALEHDPTREEPTP